MCLAGSTQYPTSPVKNISSGRQLATHPTIKRLLLRFRCHGSNPCGRGNELGRKQAKHKYNDTNGQRTPTHAKQFAQITGNNLRAILKEVLECCGNLCADAAYIKVGVSDGGRLKTRRTQMKLDTDIRRYVETELQWDPSLDERGVAVKVTDGVVTLVGEVAHYADRYAAEEVAKRVNRVRAIANELEVRIPRPGERSDRNIASAAANALKWNVSLGSSDVKAVLNHGWLTLSGQVECGYRKSVAGSGVRYLSGVAGITNEIAVQPSVKIADVK